MRKGNFYIRQIPNTEYIDITPRGISNVNNTIITMNENEYSQFYDWIENDPRPIKEVLTFLSSKEQNAINDNIDYTFTEERI